MPRTTTHEAAAKRIKGTGSGSFGAMAHHRKTTRMKKRKQKRNAMRGSAEVHKSHTRRMRRLLPYL